MGISGYDRKCFMFVLDASTHLLMLPCLYTISLYLCKPDVSTSFLLVTQGYAPICLGLEDFYTRRLYLRIQVGLLLQSRLVVINF